MDCIGWRYDPIFIDENYSVEWHLAKFEKMAKNLAGYTKTCVISFIDLYKKVERNFPEAREVSREDRICLGKECIRIAGECGREPVLAFWEMTLELTTPVPIFADIAMQIPMWSG